MGKRILVGKCSVCGETVKVRTALNRLLEFHNNRQNVQCEKTDARGNRIRRQATSDLFGYVDEGALSQQPIADVTP